MRRRRPRLLGIYTIYCWPVHRTYIGSSRDVAMRWNSHLVALLENQHSNQALQQDFNTYGMNAFDFSLLKRVEKPQDLRRAEQEEIDKHFSGQLYNKVRASRKAA